jgi:hypothetical protein
LNFVFFFNKYFRRQIKKRKDQIDSYKSKISTDEDQLQFSLNLDDFHKQKDQSHVIEQSFPDPSILGPQLLVPDNQKRLFIELDFAKEQTIEDYEENVREIKRQTKKHHDTIEEEKEQLPSDKKDISIEEENIYIEDQSVEIPESKLKEKFVEKRLSETEKSVRSSEEDQTKMKSPIIKDDISNEKDTDKLRKSSSLSVTMILPSSTENLLSKSTAIILPNTTKDLTTILSES